jgi:hypothetical protein
VSRSLSGFAVVCVLISLPFLAWGAWDWRQEHRAAEITQNLPIYPGAELIRGADDYLAYQLPPGTPRATVERFYNRQMEGWERPDDSCPGFRRDGALVLVDVEAAYLSVLVKPRGAGECDEWSWFVHS